MVIAPPIIECVILDAINMHDHLGFPPRVLFAAFRTWSILTNPKAFSDDALNFGPSRRLAKEMADEGKKAFLDRYKRDAADLALLPAGASVFCRAP